MSRNYRQLKVYQLARDLVVEVYRKTAVLPPEEKFGLTAQIRRAVISIAANIVEGSARRTEKDYVHFLGIALGSAHELTLLLELCGDLKFMTGPDLAETLDHLDHLTRSLQRMVDGLGRPEAGSRKPEAG